MGKEYEFVNENSTGDFEEKSTEAADETFVSDIDNEVDAQDKNTYILSAPFEYEDEVYNKLSFDFDKLTGADIQKAHQIMRQRGDLSPRIDNSQAGLCVLAAAAAGIDAAIIPRMPLKDCKAITGIVKKYIEARQEGVEPSESPAGTYIHKFAEPYAYNGVKYDTLIFYFDRLCGDDLLAASSAMSLEGDFTGIIELSYVGQCVIASRAASVERKAIENMPIAEYLRISRAVKDFLLDLE